MNTTTRASAMPEVPTVAKATPRLTKAFVEALTSPELKARLAGLMAEPMAPTREQSATLVKREHAKHERVVKASGVKVE